MAVNYNEIFFMQCKKNIIFLIHNRCSDCLNSTPSNESPVQARSSKIPPTSRRGDESSKKNSLSSSSASLHIEEKEEKRRRK